MVRACVDNLTKGPPIAPHDKEGLQRYADTAQVMYDNLEALNLNCLGEMNTDNLEKMILRLPKWAQAKFREHLKKLERQGQIMPTFKDVVEFLNDRADVANHPFFTSSSTEANPQRSPTLMINPARTESPHSERVVQKKKIDLRTRKTTEWPGVPCAPSRIHSTVVKISSPNQSKKEVNSSGRSGSALTASIPLSTHLRHASHWYVVRLPDVGSPIIRCCTCQALRE